MMPPGAQPLRVIAPPSNGLHPVGGSVHVVGNAGTFMHGHAFPFFAVANAPENGAFDQAIATVAGGLPVSAKGRRRSARVADTRLPRPTPGEACSSAACASSCSQNPDWGLHMRRKSLAHLSHANRTVGRPLRCLLAALVASAALLALLPAGSAWGQVPPNDTFANATVIPSLPFTDTVDTTQATTDSDDAELVSACNQTGISFAATVWYAFTPSTDQWVGINTSGSTYTVAGAVVTGAPGSFSRVSCFAGSGSFSAVAGQTYYIDLGDISGGGGGTLNISVDVVPPQPPPQPVVELSVDPVGRLNPRTGAATVSGTTVCLPGASWTLAVTLSQDTGATTISGSGTAGPVVCDGTTQPWSLSIQPSSGRFVRGNANVDADATVCLSGTCVSDHVQQTITLRR
jgi:Family of unknown function (DUF6299)